MNYYDDRTDLTKEEKEALEKERQAQAAYDAWGSSGAIGSTVGSIGGAVAGGLIGAIPTMGGAALPGASIGAGLGGSLGGLIGNGIGYLGQNAASEEKQKLEAKRLSPDLEKKAKREAFQRLLGKYSKFQ